MKDSGHETEFIFDPETEMGTHRVSKPWAESDAVEFRVSVSQSRLLKFLVTDEERMEIVGVWTSKEGSRAQLNLNQCSLSARASRC